MVFFTSNLRLIRRICQSLKQAEFWSCLIVLLFCLYPYDFFLLETLQNSSLKSFIAQFFSPESLSVETLINLLIFLPFGASFANHLGDRHLGSWKSLLSVVYSAFLLTFIVEILQGFLPGRNPSCIDLILNVLGAIAGFLIFKLYGFRIKKIAQFMRNKLRIKLSRRRLFIIFFGYLIFVLLGSISLQRMTTYLWSPTNWDTTFPLIVGNELEGDRPWNGEISSLCLASRVVTAQPYEKFPKEKACDFWEQTFSSIYDLGDLPPINDRTGKLPPLLLQGVFETSSTPIKLSPNMWLQTSEAISQLSDQVRQSGQLAIGIVLKSHQRDQFGPARIISISNGPYERNFMLGQESNHLYLRLRTPLTGKNGTRIGFVVPHAFAESSSISSLLLKFNQAHLMVQTEPSSSVQQFRFTPGTTLFWLISPLQKVEIHLTRKNRIFYDSIFYGLIFIPLGRLWVGIFFKYSKNFPGSFLMKITGILVPIVALETALSLDANRAIQWTNLWISFIIYGIALIGFSQKYRDQPKTISY